MTTVSVFVPTAISDWHLIGSNNIMQSNWSADCMDNDIYKPTEQQHKELNVTYSIMYCSDRLYKLWYQIKNVVVLKQHFNCRSSLINLLYRNIANITLNLNCGINNEVKGLFPRYHELVVIHVILLNKVQNNKSFRNNMLKPM